MISDTLLKLMTAAVDGEASAAGVQLLQHALDSNPEACTLFGQLQLDGNRIRALPKVAPPAELHQRIMELVASADAPIADVPVMKPIARDHRLPTTEPVIIPVGFKSRRMSSRWLPIAAAASVLFAITTSSFMFFQQQLHTTRVVKNLEQSLTTDLNWAKLLPADNNGLSATPIPHGKQGSVDPDTFVGPAIPGIHATPDPESLAIAPLPRQLRPNFHGAAPLPETQFDYLDVRVPFLRQVAEFDREDTREQLIEELAFDPAYRIDVFVRNPTRAVSLLRSAAKASGVTLYLDSNSMIQLQKSNTNSLVIYSETMTPDDLSQLFAKLCAVDAKVSPRVFDFMHTMAVSTNDAKFLREVLGFDPGLFKRFAPAAGTDQPKANGNAEPIGAGTADHIVKALTAGKAKEVAQSAILMTWAPLSARTSPETSAEMKQFVAKRAERKPNAVPVMIVIRPAN